MHAASTVESDYEIEPSVSVEMAGCHAVGPARESVAPQLFTSMIDEADRLPTASPIYELRRAIPLDIGKLDAPDIGVEEGRGQDTIAGSENDRTVRTDNPELRAARRMKIAVENPDLLDPLLQSRL